MDGLRGWVGFCFDLRKINPKMTASATIAISIYAVCIFNLLISARIPSIY
jgi:hypothetical protein